MLWDTGHRRSPLVRKSLSEPIARLIIIRDETIGRDYSNLKGIVMQR